MLLITYIMNPFDSSVPVSHDSVTATPHAQYQDAETEPAKWNSAIIHFIFKPAVFLLRHVKMSRMKSEESLRYKVSLWLRTK